MLARESGGEFKLMGETVQPEYQLNGIEWSSYDIAVVAVGIDGKESTPVILRHDVQGLDRNLLPVTNLALVDEPAADTFESQSPRITWDAADDAFVQEYGISIRTTGLTLLYGPVFTANTEYVVDYETLKDISLPRSFVVEVVALDKFGFQSQPTRLTISNTAPDAPSSVTMDPSIGSCVISAALPSIRDLGGFVVAVHNVSGFLPDDYTVYKGPSLTYQFVGETQSQYYCRVAYYDVYKPNDFTWSSEFSFTTAGLDYDDQSEELKNLYNTINDRLEDVRDRMRTLGKSLLDLDSRTWMAVERQDETQRAVSGEFSASIRTIKQAAADLDSALASVILELEAARDGEVSLGAKITSINQAFADIDEAIGLISTEITAARDGETDLSARLASILQAQVDGDDALAEAITEVEAISNAGTANGKIRFTAASGVSGVLAAVDIETSATGASGSFNKSGLRLVVWDDAGTVRSKIQLSADKIETLKADGSPLAVFDATTGKVLAAAIEATYLSAITANMGTITAGVLQSTDGRFIVDLNNKQIIIKDSSDVVVLELGYYT